MSHNRVHFGIQIYQIKRNCGEVVVIESKALSFNRASFTLQKYVFSTKNYVSKLRHRESQTENPSFNPIF